MKKNNLLTYLPLLLLLTQCNNIPSSEQDTSPDINEFIYETMHDVYLWNDQIPDVDYTSYSDPEALFNAMLYKEKDKWSYMYKIDTSMNLEYNQSYGYGFYPVCVKKNDLWNIRIGYVQENSQSYQVGLRRGDTIISIDGTNLSNYLSEEALTTAFQNAVNKDSLSLIKKNTTGSTTTITIQKSKYYTKNIGTNTTFTSNKGNVGYFEYRSFSYLYDPNDKNTYNPYADLDNVFSYFSNRGIQELIIDLRYNGGGSIDIARHIASLIYNEDKEIVFQKSYTNGDNFENSLVPYATSVYNYALKNSDFFPNMLNPQRQSFTFNFDATVTPTGLRRIFFITSNMTASASESLISSLTPFIDVVLIGTTTHGKPVGMSGFTYGGYVFYPIMFRGYNAVGFGDFYTGLTPDVEVQDDLDFSFDNRNEPCIKAALNYIETNTISANLSPSISIQPVKMTPAQKIFGAF